MASAPEPILRPTAAPAVSAPSAGTAAVVPTLGTLRALALVLTFGATLAACPEPDSARITPDPKQRVELEMARRTLVRIGERRQRGLEIGGDCKTVERLFLPALAKLRHAKAKALRRRLVQVCATDRRDRGARGRAGQ